MNYWPLSLIAQSPIISAAYLGELYMVLRTCQMSQGCFAACLDAARHTQPVPMTGLVVVESIDAPARQLFTERPSNEAWLRLERGGAILGASGEFHIIIDAVH